MSEVTLHRWRAEYGAADRDAVRRPKELEKENARLKRLVAWWTLSVALIVWSDAECLNIIGT